MSEVVLIRTDHYSSSLDCFVRSIAAQTGRRIIILADESKGELICPSDIRKISLKPSDYGLYATTDVMWRCGDYGLYAALDSVSDASAFWLVEPDVRIHSPDLGSFFNGTGGSRHIDFVTPWFVPASREWVWYSSMEPYARQVFNCMMQICRISRPAVQYLFTKRRKLGNFFISHGLNGAKWPNDEAFVAASLVEGGFSIGTLKDHAPSYRTAGTLTFIKPTSLRWLTDLPPNHCIYHPVVEGEKFFQRAVAYLKAREKTVANPGQLLQEFDADFAEQIQVECGSQAVEAFRAEVRDSVRRFGH